MKAGVTLVLSGPVVLGGGALALASCNSSSRCWSKGSWVQANDDARAAAAGMEVISAIRVGLIGLATAIAIAGCWRVWRRKPQLESTVTVCAWTRRAPWHGKWITFEEFLSRRSNVRSTRGICREAAEVMERGGRRRAALNRA